MKQRNKRRRDITMMLSDPLKAPDYSTPNKKKRFVESHCRKVQDAVISATGDDERSFLQSPYGERRQKAILASLDRAEAEFKGFGLRSVVESFVQNELSPFNNYNHIDSDMDLRIGAALWILDKLRACGKLHEAYKILPDTSGNPDVWYLPTDFHHVCYDNDLIQSVIYVIATRFSAESGKHAGNSAGSTMGHSADSSVITEPNARGKEFGETWKQLLALLPEKEVTAACDVFKDKVWELATRNMKGQAYYDREISQLMRKIQNAQNVGSVSGPLADPMMNPKTAPQPGSQPGPQSGPFAQKPVGMPGIGGLPGLGGMLGGVSDDTIELARRGEELVEQDHEYTRNFDRFLQMDKRAIRKETGSREVAEALAGFVIDDPYELCFALFYLIDTGDDAPWLMRSGCTLMTCAQALLPWFVMQEDWDDEDWDSWFDGMQYNQNGWLEKGSVPDPIDYLHDIHNGKNSAQIIYRLSRSVVPIGLHPFEDERKQLIAEGMDEGKARKIVDTAELMFLQSFQAKQYRAGDFDFDWEDQSTDEAEDEDKTAADKIVVTNDSGKATLAAEGDQKAQVNTPVKLGGYWGKVAAGQGLDIVESASAAQSKTENPATSSEALEQMKAELEQAKKQIKGLRAALSSEKRTADAERAKYEHELKGLRMEHRELADLRSIVFNQENGNTERLEKVEKRYEYPYETKKRTVIFGGHDTFLKAIKPMLPTVKFVDASNLAFNPDIIRNADVVWIQNNCISHSQFWNIVKTCKLAEVQMRYFGFASAEKCAEQLVTEDRK